MTNPNDCAFPCGNDTTDSGLTIREYFTAKAIVGLLASESAGGYTPSRDIADRAVSIADAAIVALNQSRNLAGLPED